MEVFPGNEDAAAAVARQAYRKRSVEALVHNPTSYDEWSWQSLPAPPLVPGPADHGYIDNRISGYAAVGESQVWAGVHAEERHLLPGHGERRVEQGLRLGDAVPGARRARTGARALVRLGGRGRRPPRRVGPAYRRSRAVWEGFTASDPEGSHLMKSCVVHLGGGRLCVVRLLEIPQPSCQCYSGKPIRCYAVFTGVEVERCGGQGFRMIRHKSCRYGLGSDKKPVCVL
uniref:Uncharacterized protein n=1 Tax=Aegilops tauschii TaxID=37682 RepID=N1QU44_AEGTA